ncbi:MAG: nucleoside-diphosphate sugar epimerase/dehydratase, partial [Planctomycetota bacterium]
MLKEHSRLMIALLGVADLVATAVAWCVACLVFGHREVMLPLLPAVLAVALVSNLAHRLYRPRRRESLLGEIVELMRSSVAMWLVVVAGLFLTGRHEPGNQAMVFFLGANCAVLILGRAVAREGLRQLRRRGYNLRHVALVGCGPSAREVVRGLDRNPWYGMVIDYVVPADDHDSGSFEGIPCRGSIDDLDDVLTEHPVDMVYLALRHDSDHLLEDLVDRLADLPVEIRQVPDV